jgi:DNA repair exonuclease SbcCD ATPase subunit
MSGNLLAVLIGLGSLVVAIIGLLAIKVDEHSALARIWAWLQRPFKEQEALKRRILELEDHFELMSALVKAESNLRDKNHRELAQLIADLKERVDAQGGRLTQAESGLMHDALELDALGIMQKQVEAQLESQVQSLETVQTQITELRRHLHVVLRASAVNHDALDMRVLKLEGLPPKAYAGKAPAPDSHDPEPDGPGFHP